jgi:hypothetical protein
VLSEECEIWEEAKREIRAILRRREKRGIGCWEAPAPIPEVSMATKCFQVM